MGFKTGDTCDLVGYKGKTTPVQIISEQDGVFTIQYLDNSGRPAGTCRANELKERTKTGGEKTPEKAPSKEKPTPKTEEKPADAKQGGEAKPEN